MSNQGVAEFGPRWGNDFTPRSVRSAADGEPSKLLPLSDFDQPALRQRLERLIGDAGGCFVDVLMLCPPLAEIVLLTQEAARAAMGNYANRYPGLQRVIQIGQTDFQHVSELTISRPTKGQFAPKPWESGTMSGFYPDGIDEAVAMVPTNLMLTHILAALRRRTLGDDSDLQWYCSFHPGLEKYIRFAGFPDHLRALAQSEIAEATVDTLETTRIPLCVMTLLQLKFPIHSAQQLLRVLIKLEKLLNFEQIVSSNPENALEILVARKLIESGDNIEHKRAELHSHLESAIQLAWRTI